MTDPISTLWMQQNRDAAPLDSEALARADTRFRRSIRWRDGMEHVAGLLGIGVFAHTAVQVPDWGVRVGCAAIIVGVLIVLRNLWGLRPMRPGSALGTPSLSFHRANLVRQRDALAGIWRWYLAPVMPGIVLLLLAVLRVSAQHMPLWAAVLAIGLAALPIAIVFWGIHRLNRIGARRLQTMIDALDRGEV